MNAQPVALRRPTWLRRRPSLRRWSVTLVATVASTYALDAFATAAGVLLAASLLLDGLGHGALLAFLAATYVVWGIGLSAPPRTSTASPG